MITRILTTATLLLLPAAAFAGDSHKCDEPVQTCLDTMVKELKTTGFIGVELDDEKGPQHLVVTKVVPKTAAEEAGIEAGDVLVALDGLAFGKANREAMSKIKVPGQKVTCTIRRDGKKMDLPLTLRPMPADVMAKYIGDHMMKHATLPKDATAKK